MNGDLISMTSDEIGERPKIKTHFARIIVGGPVTNPCYSILWYDPSDRDYHIGYSSYSLMNVYDWLRDEFEIASSHFDNEPVVHGRWIDSNGAIRCSECLHTPLYDYHGRLKLSKACPTCGANMWKEREE